jgi:N-acetylneuraminic acid mutarotase
MKTILILTLFSAFTQGLFAQWTLKAPAPGTKWAHNSVSLNGYIYVVSGSSGQTYRYDPLANSWTTLASIPTPRSYAAAAAANGKIYVIGGSIGAAYSNLVEEYDPVTNTWATKTPALGLRTTTTAAAVGDKIYYIGGWNGASMTDCHVYDVLTDSWSVAAPMPTARSHMKAVTIGSTIYVAAGYTTNYVGLLQAYNTVTNSWSTLATMNFPRYLFGLGAMNGQVWAAAGYTGAASNRTEYYDPATNTWTNDANMNVARYRTDGTVVGSCFYIVAGFNGSNLSSIEELCTTPLLPVTLIDFSGEYTGVRDETLLNWRTASEQENSHFEVYRSRDGESFAYLGEVKGAGTTTSVQTYSFMDYHSEPGVNYYRLDQVDINGSRKASETIAVVRGALSSHQLHAWPNPSEGVLYTRIDHGGNGIDGQISLYDLQGNCIGSQATTGIESILRFDLSALEPGVYLLHYTSPEGETSTLKITRQ